MRLIKCHLICLACQFMGFAWSHGGQFAEPQLSGACKQQANETGPLAAGGLDPPREPHTPRQPLEVRLPTHKPQTLAGDLPL